MEKLKNEILKEFGLNLELKPFGDNEARNNVFLGESREKAFIIKLEDVKQLEQVKLSINVASNLLKSDLVSSSRYIANTNGDLYYIVEDKIITVQEKEQLIKLQFEKNEDLINLGKIIGEFHVLLSNMILKNLSKSNFYKDFMWGKVPLAQSSDRLMEIETFYRKYTPNYELLTQGVVHNDLNLNNIFCVGKKFFFIDFEFLKKSPLISDLGVLLLEFWDSKKGAQDYIDKLKLLLEGYEKKVKLSEYDKNNIIVFSLRYLFSDENWYNYWSYNGNPAVRDLIPEVREKQKLLLQIIS